MAKTSSVAAGLFPLPIVIGDSERDGLIWSRSSSCEECTHQKCLTGVQGSSPQVCDNGVSYARVAPDVVIRGVLVDPTPTSDRTKRRLAKRLRRREPHSVVPHREFERYAAAISKHLAEQAGLQRATEQRELRAQYEKQIFEDWAIREVRKATNGLSAGIIHDQLQLVSTIYQNMDHVLTLRYGDTDRALEADLPSPVPLRDARRVWDAEKAVFLTCELLNERQRAARLLTEDGAAYTGEWSRYNPHRLFTKFAKLYRKLADDKGVRILLLGSCYAQCLVPYEITSIPALALLDNAIKYSPSGSTVTIRFQEIDAAVRVTVESTGPRIDEDEREKIFTLYRGRNASNAASGAGIGLWQARLAIRGWATLNVEQDDAPVTGFGDRFRTVFALTIQKNAVPPEHAGTPSSQARTAAPSGG